MGLVDTVLELCISHKLQTPRLAYDTGRKMWLPKFSLFGHLLAEKVKTQPELILSAEVSWKYFSRVAHIFIAECKDPEIAHARASGWKLENYKPVARQLASIVSEDINLAYDVGAKFPDERFEPIKDIAIDAFKENKNIQFVLCGDGGSFENIKNLFTGLDNVVFPVDSGPNKTTLIQSECCCLSSSSMLKIQILLKL